ncbi:AgmX/PglI C-terminal domain-containing protein, partial [Corallococcus terminator]|uniref:AgmX/PglI C-terminal domain-containing protein n=1 Tax=Corallococcus terminator TaxID=2316733 RepID=UPI0011C36940
VGLVLAGTAFVVARPGSTQGATVPVQTQPEPVKVAEPVVPTAPVGTPPVAVAPQAPGPTGTPGESGAVPGGDTVATSVTDVPPPEDVPEEPTPRKGTVRAPKEKVTLGIEDIQRVVSSGRSKITGCFERYKSNLPSTAGEVQVQLTIVSSGKVRAGTRGPLASTDVGRCLETQAQALRFPAHRDQEVTVLMPFSWKVTQ